MDPRTGPTDWGRQLGLPCEREKGIGSGIVQQHFQRGYLQWSSSEGVTLHTDETKCPQESEPAPTGPGNSNPSVPIKPIRSDYYGDIPTFNVKNHPSQASTAMKIREITEDHRGPVLVQVSTNLTGEKTFAAIMKLHGATSADKPKRSFRLKFITSGNDDYRELVGAKQIIDGVIIENEKPELNLFGLGESKLNHIVFNAAWIDPTQMRNWIVFRTINSMGGLAPRIGHAAAHIEDYNVGKLGFYQVIEKVNKTFLKDRGLEKSAQIYKANTHYKWGDDNLNAEHFEFEGEGASLETLKSFMQSFCGGNLSLLNQKDYVVFNMVRSFFHDTDTWTKNYFVIKEPEKAAWRLINWDADATLFIDWEGKWIDKSSASKFTQSSEPIGSILPGYGQRSICADSFFSTKIESYKNWYRCELESGRLHPAYVIQQINNRLDEIKFYLMKDLENFPRGNTLDDQINWLRAAIWARGNHDMDSNHMGVASKIGARIIHEGDPVPANPNSCAPTF